MYWSLKWTEYCCTIETIDSQRKRLYTQTSKENLTIIEKPTIKYCSKKPYTSFSFIPDYKRFGLDNITDDIYDYQWVAIVQ